MNMGRSVAVGRDEEGKSGGEGVCSEKTKRA